MAKKAGIVLLLMLAFGAFLAWCQETSDIKRRQLEILVVPLACVLLLAAIFARKTTFDTIQGAAHKFASLHISSWTLAIGGLGLAAVASLVGWAFSFSIASTSVWAYDASRFTFTATVVAGISLALGRVWSMSRAPSSEAPSRRKTYSVPRQFGLATLLVVTFACAGLSAIFRWLQLPGNAALLVLCFISIISAAQFAFNRTPRWASVLAGSVSFLLASWAMWRFSNRPPINVPASELAFAFAWSAVRGGVAGYLTGASVGGIFMVIAGVNALFTGRPENH